MEMDEIGNKEMAAEYGDKSYWFKLKMGNNSMRKPSKTLNYIKWFQFVLEKIEAYLQEGWMIPGVMEDSLMK